LILSQKSCGEFFEPLSSLQEKFIFTTRLGSVDIFYVWLNF
jgi:hypothetical protein